MPAVSIIMNVRNGAATLRAALDSALGQTFADWELIVWDDCSTDDSAAIIAELTDPRIRYFLAPEQTALGQARDAAIRCAQGDWLAFLDQDDLWLARKLELQLALADSRDVGLIYGRTISFSPSGKQYDYDPFHEFGPLPVGNIVAELLGKGCFIAMSSALIRRSVVMGTGGIPAHIRITPDYFLYLAVCSKYSARAVQDVVCRYRLHAGSMTSVYRRESLEETLQLVDDWRSQVSRGDYARRRAHISTALAVEELRHSGSFVQGIRRLMKEGSLAWLAGRPFVHGWRMVRRKVRTPYRMHSK
ncbi:MAG: glycosyltransferase [Candidatus Korobacteraceae bacterium]